MKNRVFEHGKVIEMTATAAVSSGDTVLEGGLVGVAQDDAAIGEKYRLHVEGVFEVTKEAPLDMAPGDVAYWDDSAKDWGATGAGKYPAGTVYNDPESADTTMYVKLKGFAVDAVV